MKGGGQVAYVTTSWDDGHPLDMRLAETLALSGVTGTIYVPLSYPPMPRLSDEQLRELARAGFEIGSHTMSHPRLDQVSEERCRQELADSKHALEDILGAPVSALCYPCGKFNARAKRLVRETGYEVGRTTVSYRTGLQFDPMAMPVGYQLRDHSRAVHARHAIREGNWGGLAAWILRCGCASDAVALASRLFESARKTGGVYHLWGHSWEIDEAGLWPKLAAILAMIARQPDVRYLTNSQLAALAWSAP
jgi:peptidoglycan-N-acetylglucosamine deacetylase